MPARCLFSCSEHVGHLNPTLPLVRGLVGLGHEVHFMCMEMARGKIEAAGAIYHDTAAVQTELYESCENPGRLAIFDIMEKQGLEMSFLNVLRCLNVSLELELPGTLRLLRRLQPDVVVYDPLIHSRAVPLAAKVLGIPAVGLLTLAGPGSMRTHAPALLRPLALEEAGQLRDFPPHLEATERINAAHGLGLKETLLLPDGYLDTCLGNRVLVTTTAHLQDPMTSALAKAYEQESSIFTFVGPLLPSPDLGSQDEDGVLRRVRAAKAAGLKVVAVSMGTVVTSNDQVAGWDADLDGRTLSGRELCRGVWAGAFDASRDAPGGVSAVLVVAALGRQPHPLGHVEVPDNAICVQSFAQVELLRSGVDVFVTHGGQNSFTEALACSTPVVVCPGFGDQEVNAKKALPEGNGCHYGGGRLPAAGA